MNWKVVVLAAIAALVVVGLHAKAGGTQVVKEVIHTTLLDGPGNGTVGGPHPPVDADNWIIDDGNSVQGPHPPLGDMDW